MIKLRRLPLSYKHCNHPRKITWKHVGDVLWYTLTSADTPTLTGQQITYTIVDDPVNIVLGTLAPERDEE
jgi:hypothetical protein